MAVDSLPPGALPPPDGGNALTRKIGGLPTWGWIAIAAAGGIAIYMYLQYRKNSAASTTSSTDTSGTTAPGYTSDADQELLAQIRDLQGANSTATTAVAGLPAPTNLKFTTLGTTGALLTWTPVSGADHYVVTWQTKVSTQDTVPIVPPAAHSYKLSRGDQVNVRVVAVDSKGVQGSPATLGGTIK